MHDAENGTHSATAAETLVLTNNLVYPDTSNFFDVININHHRHGSGHHHLSHLNHQSQYYDNLYNHDISSNVDQSNSNDLSLFQNQNPSLDNGQTLQLNHEHQLQHQNAQTDQLITHPYCLSGHQVENEPPVDSSPQHQAPSETHLADNIMIDATNCQESSDRDGTKSPPSDANILKLDDKSSSIFKTSPSYLCNTLENDTPELSTPVAALHPDPSVSRDDGNHSFTLDAIPPKIELDCATQTISQKLNINENAEIEDDGDTDYNNHTETEGDDDEDAEEDEDDEDDDDDDVDDDDDDDDDENQDDDEDDEDDDDDDDDDDESEEDSEDIVDPGQHCQLIQQSNEEIDANLIEHDESGAAINDILDGERMLEVTRKLVRNTERDPDRDLRKQVLLRTAIKKLPHFMEYNRYSDSLDHSFHSNMSPQTYYEHHDSQQKFYHSVQPNAIQMSTTSLRMLDLNDDHDPELVNIEPERCDPNLGYSTRTNLEQHDYVTQHQYDRYHQRIHDLNHYETNSPIMNRHNSLENIYQPINGTDITENIKDGDERIPIAFQIACEIYDFTCAPDDNERKLLDNLTNGYYTKPTKEPKSNLNDSGEDGVDTRDQEGSDTSSSSNSSSSDESCNSLGSRSAINDETNNTSILEVSLNSSSDFYHGPHDSGVAIFGNKSNKRSSSSIGLDDEMEIDHLTELSTRSPSIGSNNQYKKLRKREIID